MSRRTLAHVAEYVVGHLPDVRTYLAVDEMREHLHALARRSPGASVLEIGRSRQGFPLEVLVVGRGVRKSLLIGCPHPNEPIGGTALLLFAESLVEYGDSLLDDWEFYVLPCADPDSTRLNEGWFKDPYNLKVYVEEYYRPPHFEQFEWSFPVKFKSLAFGRPLPETKAVMDLLEKTRPLFLYSIHNTTISGVHYYVTREWPDLYDPLLNAAHSYGLPLTLGLPRMPRARRLAGSVFLGGSVHDFYELYESLGIDPVSMVEGGTNSTDYAATAGVSLGLVSEVPLYVNAKVGDTAETSATLEEVVRGGKEVEERLINDLAAIVDPLLPLMATPSPFRTTVADALFRGKAKLALRHRSVSSGASRKATVAEAYDAAVEPTVHWLLRMGQALRMVRLERTSNASASEAIDQAEKVLHDLVSRTLENLLGTADLTPVPLQTLIRVELTAFLAVLSSHGFDA